MLNMPRSVDIDQYTNEILGLLFQQMPMGIIVLNPSFELLRYNTTWVSFFEEYKPDVISQLQVGVNYFDLLPETLQELRPAFLQALNGETVSKQELRITIKDKTSYWNIAITPLAEDGAVICLVVVGTDVTSQVEAHQALQDALNELNQSHQSIEQGIQERTRKLETVIRVQQTLTSSLNIQDVLQVIAREARRLTRADVGAVFLPENDNLVLAALSSKTPLDIDIGYRISLADSITGTSFRTRKTLLVQDITQHGQVDRIAIDKARLKSILSVPLLSGKNAIGVLSVGNERTGKLTSDTERLLMLMIPATVIALENVRVYEQASKTAVAAERGRLAWDLHDSVTQTLFSASLTAEVLPRIWARDAEEGMIRLEKLRELTRGALAEMRTLLLELRPATLVDMSLNDLLHQLAEGIAARSRIDIEVKAIGDAMLTEDVKIALYRIAQEALNNVAKHSKATMANVTLNYSANNAELCISDNGTGFDITANRAQHLGLRIMAERAEEIQASLKIDTTTQQGTEVTVFWEA